MLKFGGCNTFIYLDFLSFCLLNMVAFTFTQETPIQGEILLGKLSDLYLMPRLRCFFACSNISKSIQLEFLCYINWFLTCLNVASFQGFTMNLPNCCVWFIWHHLATFFLLESHVKRCILAIPQPTIEFKPATEPSGMSVFLLNPSLLAHLKKHPPSCTTTSFTLITDDTSFIWDSDVWWQSKLCGGKWTGPFVFFHRLIKWAKLVARTGNLFENDPNRTETTFILP